MVRRLLPLLLIRPDDKIVIARFGAPHGVCGLVRVHIFSRIPDFLAALPIWFYRKRGEEWAEIQILSCAQYGKKWVAQLCGIDDRELAQRLCHGEIAILRSALPEVEENTFYWCDLVGMRVINRTGDDFGQVIALDNAGEYDVLVIKDEKNSEILIPFNHHYVDEVLQEEAVIRVDWQFDW